MPDVSGLQEEVLAVLKSRLGDGLEDVNMSSLVESWFTQGLTASRKFQQLFATAVGEALAGDTQSSATAAGGATNKNND
jgi:hypothetical protein